MNILLNILRNHGVSDRVADSINAFDLNFWDLIIDSKREEAFKNKRIQSNFKKSVFAMSQLKNQINIDLLNDPMILLSFNVLKKDLLYLISIGNVSNIEDLKCFISEGHHPNPDSSYRQDVPTALLKVELALNEFDKWKKSFEGNMYINKEKILLLLFELKKASFNEISKNIYIQNMAELLNQLSNEGYIFKYKDMFYFPNNIFYSQTEVIKNGLVKDASELNELISQDIKNISLLKKRLAGETLQQIAEENGVTRERIRQKTKIALDKIGDSKEFNKYKSMFEKYQFTEQDFCLLFNESKEIFNYLKLKCNKGEENPEQYILESNIPINIKIQYFEQNQFMLTRNGEVKKVDKLEYFNEILFKYKDTIFTAEKLYILYQKEAQKYSSLDLTLNSSRAIEGLASRSKYAISSNHSEFRYYDSDLTEENLNILSNMVDLPNGLYSMNKIHLLNPDIMQDLGILNEYELHNLYKKLCNDLELKEITLTRSPEFIIGDIKKEEFVYDILKQFSGESIHTIIEYMYKEFGLRKNSMLSFVQKNFRHLISNQIVNMDYEIPSQVELNILYAELDKDFYLKREVEEIMIKNPNITHKFSKHLMNDIGYHTSGESVFSQKYGNIKEAISTIILKTPQFIRGNSELDQSQVMATYLAQLERDYKIIRISKNVYMQMSYLESRGITIALMKSFIDSVEISYRGKDYFSLPQIVKDGFSHPLLDFGFDSIFYDRILAGDKRINVISRVTPMLFKVSTDSTVNLQTFLSDILCDYQNGIMLDDFTDDINEKFYINMNRDNVKEQLKKYGAFYSRELDKFYFYKEQYLDEVYGK